MQKLLNASAMAGMAYGNTGLGLNHALACILSKEFFIPLNTATAILFLSLIHIYILQKCKIFHLPHLKRIKRIIVPGQNRRFRFQIYRLQVI